MKRQPAWRTSPPPTWEGTPTPVSTSSTTTSPRAPVPCVAGARHQGRRYTAVWSAPPAGTSTSGYTWCLVSTCGTRRSAEEMDSGREREEERERGHPWLGIQYLTNSPVPYWQSENWGWPMSVVLYLIWSCPPLSLNGSSQVTPSVSLH